jgi:hypothetical protein
MSSFPRLQAEVQRALKDFARGGSATKSDVAVRVWTRIEKLGGPSKYGIGLAAMTMGCMHYINAEVTRQFKSSLTDHEFEYILPGRLPDELISIVAGGKVQRWIAIEEGTDAMWVYWRKATVEHWQANAGMKKRKADQTQVAAQYSKEIADYMETHGIKSLGDVFKEK